MSKAFSIHNIMNVNFLIVFLKFKFLSFDIQGDLKSGHFFSDDRSFWPSSWNLEPKTR